LWACSILLFLPGNLILGLLSRPAGRRSPPGSRLEA